jgi:hypothetical protein
VFGNKNWRRIFASERQEKKERKKKKKDELMT